MEKRAFTRQTLHHLGEFSSPKQKLVPCIIKDFCKTGLFIVFDKQPSTHLNVGDELFVDFRSSGVLQLKYRLHVRIARIAENAIGVQITHDNPEAIHALYKLAREPGIQNEAPAPNQHEAIKEHCQTLIFSFIESTDKPLFQAIDEELLNRAERARDNQQVSVFVDTASRFKQYQSRIATGFKRTFKQQVENWLTGLPVSLPEANPSVPSQNLSLVEKDDFEDWLLVKVVVNRADQHYKESLYDLQLRMTELTGSTVTQQNNPLNPTYISHAFYKAIMPLALDRVLIQAVLHAFEATVISKGLKRLYGSLNDLLIRHNILPEITYQATVSASVKAVEQNIQPPTTAVADNEQSPKPAEATLQASMQQAPPLISSSQTLSAVQKLLFIQQPSITGQTSASDHVSALPTEELLSQLTQLQSQPPTSTEQQQPLRERLRSQLGGEQVFTVGDTSAIDVTEQFFKAMDNNPYLAETIKPVFKQLEIPLLKVFIQDESFFDDQNHPARQVLNRLAKLGHNGSRLSPQYEKIVSQAINDISLNFNDDNSVFNEAVTELDQIISKQEAVTQRNTERLIKSYDGLETLEKAKYSTRRFIEQQLSGKLVLQTLIELINHGWRELLVFTLLRDGQDSAIWKSYANVVGSLGNISPDTDLKTLQQMGSGILKIVNIGIKEAPGGQAQMTRLLPDLEALLTGLDGTAPVFVEADKLLAAPDDIFYYIDDEAIQNKALSRWVRRARNLKVGDWLEYNKDKEPTQMHLAWLGQDHHKFVFVNHQGMKVIEFTLREMAEQLQGGNVRLIEAPDEPFVDQNLDAMIQGIYNQMSYQANHDELTGLINRKQFERELARHIAHAKSKQSEHTVCQMNLDQFKVINNTCGRDAGDQLLIEMSQLLTRSLQPPHIVARIAADEFILLLHGTDTHSAKNITAALKQNIQNHRFQWGNNTYTVSASFGIAAVDETSENINAVLNAADSAHLTAKESGQNKVHIYQPNDKEQAARVESINNIARLNSALDEERLKLRCQKISPVHRDNHKPHYEILLSIEDELGIHLAPGDFIHAAERYNRMPAIDRWIIHNVFIWAMENEAQLEQLDCLTINLSGYSLNDDGLMDYILDELLETGIPRGKICFEITETTAITNLTDAVELITELKELGFKFALDDFGSGLSSYAYLKKNPIDYLKIDGSFIRNIAHSDEDLAMVKSINEMAHTMGKQTIAECVENEVIQQKLNEIGVDYLQGYNIEKPMPLENLAFQSIA